MNAATDVTTNTTWWHFDAVSAILLVTTRVTVVWILPVFQRNKNLVRKL